VRDPRPGDAVGPSNRDGNQLIVLGDRYGWIVAIIVGILALAAVFYLLGDIRSMRGDLENIRGLIENSAAAAQRAAVDAALAAERAEQSRVNAAINREYAVQVVGQLNRMGFPVMSPGEKDHPLAQPADYAALEEFRKQQEQP
jgi:hypothetical protein